MRQLSNCMFLMSVMTRWTIAEGVTEVDRA